MALKCKNLLPAALLAVSFFIGVEAECQPTNNLIFHKILEPGLELETVLTEVPYVRLSKEEKERRTQPGGRIIDPEKTFRIDFTLVHGQNRQIIWSRDHFISEMWWANQFTVLDAANNNKAIYILFKQGQHNYLETVALMEGKLAMTNPPVIIYEDMEAIGNVAKNGTLFLQDMDAPDIVFKLAAGGRKLFQFRDGHWIDRTAVGRPFDWFVKGADFVICYELEDKVWIETQPLRGAYVAKPVNRVPAYTNDPTNRIIVFKAEFIDTNGMSKLHLQSSDEGGHHWWSLKDGQWVESQPAK